MLSLTNILPLSPSLGRFVHRDYLTFTLHFSLPMGGVKKAAWKGWRLRTVENSIFRADILAAGIVAGSISGALFRVGWIIPD